MRINGIKYHLLVSFLLLLFDSCGKPMEVEDLCEGILCQNNGICLDGTCECVTGFSGPNCEQEVGSDLKLRTQFGSTNTLKVATDGIYAIWWDPQFDHTDDLPTLFGWLNETRTDCLTNLGMEDPPNPAAGYYYNVYIHHGEADILPNSWGNGQGTDSYGMPFLTLPEGAHLEYGNVLHEGFHIFQYSANSPGFAYSGDSQWYVESAAQWYAAQNEPDGIHTFIEAGAITCLLYTSDAADDL